MAWRVDFEDEAKKELGKLDKQNALRITSFLRTRVQGREDPRSVGQALKGGRLGELWKYRVGDYRILASVEDDAFRVLVLKVGHRREVYR